MKEFSHVPCGGVYLVLSEFPVNVCMEGCLDCLIGLYFFLRKEHWFLFFPAIVSMSGVLAPLFAAGSQWRRVQLMLGELKGQLAREATRQGACVYTRHSM